MLKTVSKFLHAKATHLSTIPKHWELYAMNDDKLQLGQVKHLHKVTGNPACFTLLPTIMINII